MRQPRHFLLAAALSLGAAPLGAQGSGPSAVDSVFARFRDPAGPGCAVAASRAGRPVLERAYGSANLEAGAALTAASVLEAGSVSKQFVAAAVALLVADGRLSLDDPVRRHVPELGAFADGVTLRHLLNHTSGLRDWGALAALAGWPRGTRAHTHAHVLEILARQQALNFAPGSEYSYSNSGYNLLAIVAERASGESLAALTRRRLFEPLGMTRTGWRDDFTAVVPGRATAYTPDAGGGYRMDMPFENVYGNGGLLTTVGDLLRWSENFRPGAPLYGRVGGRALVELMQTRAVLAGGDTIAYALGLFVDRYRGVPEVAHSGATAGYRAYLARYPRQGLAVAVLCNHAGAPAAALARGAAAALLGGAFERPAPAAAVVPARLAPRVALYRDSASGDLLQVALRGDTLRLGFDGGTPLVPTGGGRFRVGAGPNELWWDDAGRAAPARVRLVRERGRTVVYTAAPLAPPADAGASAGYAGRYASEELGVDYLVEDAGGRLTVRLAPAPAVPLVPADRDAFRYRDAGGWRLVRFTRDAAGRVSGFELTTDRVYRLRFARR